ncbi:hypothetical protein G0Q06_04585 [Puniceicoccales bacterium CK1056]|uniref:Heparin-sulfate lyase N-terminal domain-containing protein n=1 Tax=Oceanipulchritudo coccoides TaxID=2706888 RepID=A0A6B2M083_9BACT|nr:hypothetical protein [Oceanipulchritudo coccoides]NDV61719.1 hypothetical protein [Oceanipulchritudo coccoides]
MKQFRTIVLLSSVLLPLAAMSAPTALDLNTFGGTGAGAYTLSGASTSGASIAYDTSNGANDIGMVTSINSGSLSPFTQVGDSMIYSFHLGGIAATNNQFTPIFRVGFDFGATAALRYATSTGTGPRLEFGSNTNGNPFTSGTVHVTHEDWCPFDLQDIRFDEGHEIDVAVSLELVAINDSLHDYQMTVTYVSTLNPSDTNSKTYTFTGVNGNQVVSLFHVTNSAGMVAGDAYTVSNASLVFSGPTVLDQVRASVDALPESTPEERVKKAVLQVEVERAANAEAVSLLEESDALLVEVQQALSRNAPEFTATNPGAPVNLPILRPLITPYVDNPYLQKLEQEATDGIATDDVLWPRALHYNQVINDVQGNYGARSAFKLMSEYLWLFGHDESPMKFDPELLKRVLRRAHAYMDSLELTPSVNADPAPNWYDQFSVYVAFPALYELRMLYPGLLMPAQLSRWDSIMNAVALDMESWYFMVLGYSPWNINIETGRLVGVMVAGLWTGNQQLVDRSFNHIDATTARLFPDGAVPYHGVGQASSNYHDILLEEWLILYELTGYQPIMDAMVNTQWRGPAMGRTEEFWTSPFYKTYRWNYQKGTEAGSELVATMSRNPYVRWLLDRDMFPDYFTPGSQLGHRYQAPWYDATVIANPLPDNYTIADRNTGGPRGWYGNFTYAGAFRPNPNSTRYEGHETLMGAMTVDDDGRVNSILVDVTPRIWQTPDNTVENGYDISAWADLTIYEDPATTISSNYSVSTSIHEITRKRAGSARTANVSGWTGRQVWIGLPDRIVGLVSTVPTAGEAAAYAINGVLRLISGGTAGAETTKVLEEIIPGTHYRYGQLDVFVHDSTYTSLTGLEVEYRVPTYPATELTFSNRASEPLPAGTQTTFPSATEFRFIVEVRPAWTTTDLTAVNVLGDQDLIGLDLVSSELSLQVWLNAADTGRSVMLQRGNLPAGTDSIVLSNGVLGRVPFDPSVPVSVNLVPGQHAVLVVSSDPEDHQVGWESFTQLIETPLIEFTRHVDGMEIEYRGTLQESSDLNSWTDMNPQPASPWTFIFEPGGKRFFRSRGYPQSQSTID